MSEMAWAKVVGQGVSLFKFKTDKALKMVQTVWAFDHTILLYLFGYLIYFYFLSHLESELYNKLEIAGFCLFPLLLLLEEKGSETEKNTVLFSLWSQSINLE